MAVRDSEKPTIERLESGMSSDEPQKPMPTVEKVDYSGAHEKTDPREIALVKKLDLWIMVCWTDKMPREFG